MENTSLASKLKALRKARNCTQVEIAEELGIVRQTYSHYETGTRTPDPETLCRIANYYHVDVGELMRLVSTPDAGNYPDAYQQNTGANALAEFIAYTSNPYNQKKLSRLTAPEKELLFFFEKLDADAQREIIEFTKIKVRSRKTC